ncbi:15296_t:CDS:2 [Racocetra persica]|uniref:15296_t:CDS:1 n=1 Tax=Racocetra persica TaxID=160502 RepID=A0ACA9LNS1_9GLOM|nr:15296_t:CDS:2 [Racocetra persica]
MSLHEEVLLHDYANEVSESSSRICEEVPLYDYANEVSESSSRIHENDKDMVNLRDPIFQERDIELREDPTNNSNHSIETSSSINIDFDPEKCK